MGLCALPHHQCYYYTSMLIANFTPEDPGNVAKPSVRISFRVIYQGRGYATCGT